MNPIHIHLMLNDIPVLGSIAGGILLIIGYITKNEDITRMSYWFLFAVSVISIPVYSTGSLAEHLISTLPNVTEEITNTHEKSALFSFAGIMILGAVAGTVIAIYRKKQVPKIVTHGMIAFTLFVGWLMIGTATTGGEIRHTELREGHPDQQETIRMEKSSKNPNEMQKPHASRSGPIKNSVKLK